MYCQRHIEFNPRCRIQCEHCEQYYKPLEDLVIYKKNKMSTFELIEKEFCQENQFYDLEQMMYNKDEYNQKLAETNTVKLINFYLEKTGKTYEEIKDILELGFFIGSLKHEFFDYDALEVAYTFENFKELNDLIKK